MKLNTTILVILLSILILNAQTTYNLEFKVTDLSKNGQEAYNQLLGARCFSIGIIRIRQSSNEAALRTLLRERKAAKALESLIHKATPEGSLYGLFGLKIKDSRIFEKELEIYKSLPELPERIYEARSGSTLPAGDVLTSQGHIILNTKRQRVIQWIERGSYDEVFRLNKSPYIPVINSRGPTPVNN